MFTLILKKIYEISENINKVYMLPNFMINR